MSSNQVSMEKVEKIDSVEKNTIEKKEKKKKKKSTKRCWLDGCRTKLKLTDMVCKCCEYLKNTTTKDIYLSKMQGLGGGKFKQLEVI